MIVRAERNGFCHSVQGNLASLGIYLLENVCTYISYVICIYIYICTYVYIYIYLHICGTILLGIQHIRVSSPKQEQVAGF